MCSYKERKCLIEEKKMIGFMADKLWDIMTISELRDNFTYEERDTVNAIRKHFSDHPEYVRLTAGEERWNKTM